MIVADLEDDSRQAMKTRMKAKLEKLSIEDLQALMAVVTVIDPMEDEDAVGFMRSLSSGNKVSA